MLVPAVLVLIGEDHVPVMPLVDVVDKVGAEVF